ncbi:MAG: bifunctional 5,10-methylenetetrahydrofolate dehydrogenase/5,10-methenyltetrahydrofolate cyclohydrolase, partial [Lachnospiraceae bacterium]|nr:bifunctional 5,10-methylenetetrahydrofolate dehydrogenase/5,10-methenyltetrahydrofolate cyclohydrolase [Lachnospiraceae bacterium]
MAELLGGPVAQKICENIIDRLEKAKKSDKYPGRLPKLAIVRVGKREDDLAYERGAVKRTEKVGMDCETFEFDTDITNEEFQKEFIKINSDNDIDGILLFMPLPKHINTQEAIANFCPDKDLDGLTLGNMAALYAGTDGYAPCTAEAVIKLLEYSDIDVDGKNVTVIGRSNVIGKPVSMMLI